MGKESRTSILTIILGLLQTWLGSNRGDGMAPTAPTKRSRKNGEPPWITEAKKVEGLHERTDHKVLSKYLASDGETLGDPAKNPWCGDMVQTVFALSLPDEKVPNNPYASINWLKFGVECEPQMYCVGVFWRGDPNGWQGHVGWIIGEHGDYYVVFGGNQKDSVCVTSIHKNRIRKRGCRWPSTYKQSNEPLRPYRQKPQTTTNEQ